MKYLLGLAVAVYLFPAVAQAEEFEDVRDILETHLQIFIDRQTITERAP